MDVLGVDSKYYSDMSNIFRKPASQRPLVKTTENLEQ